MSLIAGAKARLRLLFGRRAAESRMDEEFRFHIEMEAARIAREERIAPVEARRRALIAFGGVEAHTEELRDTRGLAWLAGMSLDFRLGFRMLLKYPGLTIVAMLALSTALGGSAAWFDLVSTMFRPTLPIAGGDRLVGIYDPTRFRFVEPRGDHPSLAGWGRVQSIHRNVITTDGAATPVRGAAIEARLLSRLGAEPIRGRLFVTSDEEPGRYPVVLLGHELWRRRFGGDSAIVGDQVQLGRRLYFVLGIMPPGFGFPVNHSFWVPFGPNHVEPASPTADQIRVIGRLTPTATLADARAELASEGLRADPYVGTLAMSAPDGMAERTVLYAANAFFLVLLGVCAMNVATLVFARAATREGEITVRIALGASRRRIIGQLVAEAMVLTVVAWAIGLAGAAWVVDWATTAFTRGNEAVLPYWWTGRLSLETVVYSAVLALAAAAFIGIAPGLKATGPGVQMRLRHAAAGGGMRFGRLWTRVIVAQVALTVFFLLAGVSIAWNVRVGRYGSPSVRHAAREYVAARAEFDEPIHDAGAAARYDSAFTELERRVATDPAAGAITYGSRLPGMGHPSLIVEVEGVSAETWTAKAATVAPDFFATFGSPVVLGRGFGGLDVVERRPIAIVDETFVREIFRGGPAVGRRVRESAVQTGTPGPWLEIVGVVRDITVRAPEAAGDGKLYRPGTPADAYPALVVIRSARDPDSLAAGLRGVAADIDPALRLYGLATLDRLGEVSRLAYAVVVRILVGLAVLALLLSAAGIYALTAFTVSRRTREIGVRAALGAGSRRLVTAIFSRSLGQVGVGILIGGIPGAMLIGWGAPEIARGAGAPLAVIAFAAVGIFMAGVALLASGPPVRRALRIEPAEVLRAEA